VVIRRQSSLNKILYEKSGQMKLFGHDNLHFKTINLAKPQKYDNICSKFKNKKIKIYKIFSFIN
jgi:hypothetical protein